jgi:8-oxo-dGTP diphosphatase
MEEVRPILTIDVVVFSLVGDQLMLVLHKRTDEPFADRLGLIGGYVRVEEDGSTLATAHRVLKQKTGLKNIFCEQLATFSGANRDPRGWSASVVYYALVPVDKLQALPVSIYTCPLTKIPELPFDHNEIVKVAIKRLRAKGNYSSLPALLLPENFTLAELRRIYETVLQENLNDSAFRRKIFDLQMIEEVVGSVSKKTARPAQLYKLRKGGMQTFERTI